jgi:hypothetical protein
MISIFSLLERIPKNRIEDLFDPQREDYISSWQHTRLNLKANLLRDWQ